MEMTVRLATRCPEFVAGLYNGDIITTGSLGKCRDTLQPLEPALHVAL